MTGTLDASTGKTQGFAILSLKRKEYHVQSRIIGLARRAIAVAVSILLFSTPAFATHEIDHRFTVTGEVRTNDGQAVPGETISFTVSNDTPIGSVVTDEHGRYSVILHVHDEDLGKIFDMTVRGVKTKVKIEFDPADKVTERGKRVDFTIEK